VVWDLECGAKWIWRSWLDCTIEEDLVQGANRFVASSIQNYELQIEYRQGIRRRPSDWSPSLCPVVQLVLPVQRAAQTRFCPRSACGRNAFSHPFLPALGKIISPTHSSQHWEGSISPTHSSQQWEEGISPKAISQWEESIPPRATGGCALPLPCSLHML
jgi:hypothetical protein